MLFYDISMPWDDIWAIFEDIQTASYMARRICQAQTFRVCKPGGIAIYRSFRQKRAHRIRDKPGPGFTT